MDAFEPDDCEEEYMLEKLHEKVDLCSQYMPPPNFPPNHGFYNRIKRFAIDNRNGRLIKNNLWLHHGILDKWFDGRA